ncbi:Fat3p Ecym_3233 [Eremothecium cymbalariae DBVPG|uniref:Uncharacterized protein n=1 Tax=Eremothecium cymbalariae (strain CBS 270.75 / DBVPG 7215 / KCTC 17166 / NRRL Y-17582) TaxID=931890 RepID=G8JRF8_ERECY|nr:Hypothetical protein Ecym_3233 [Eremothecium cymbalariae DBVPG\
MRAGNIGKGVAVVGSFLALLAIVLTIVAMSGLTQDRAPVNKIYMGEADISAIKVAKVLPQADSILQFMGIAMTSGKVKDEQIFGALKGIAHTAALQPLLLLLADTGNLTGTLKALNELTPMASTGNPDDTAELRGMYSMLQSSTNVTGTMNALSSLVKGTLAASPETNSNTAQARGYLQTLLLDSRSPVDTVGGMLALAKLTEEDKEKLVGTFGLLRNSNDLNATLADLKTLLDADISESLKNSTFSQLSQNISNAQTIIQRLSEIDGEDADALNALGDLLSHSKDPSSDLEILQNVGNVTDTERTSLASLTTIISNANNSTLTIATVLTLSAQTTPQSAAQLVYLHQILANTNDQAGSLHTLNELQGASTNQKKAELIPYLFELTDHSYNVLRTFGSLISLADFAAQNPEPLVPVLAILGAAAGSETTEMSVEAMQKLSPQILSYFDVPSRFRLGIFDLCTIRVNGTSKGCTRQGGGVQGFDYRSILYRELLNSDLEPFVKALDIKADDLHLEGKLLEKEPMYRPSVSACLAFTLISLVVNFLLIVSLLLPGKGLRIIPWSQGLLALLAVGALGLAASVVAIVTAIIKEGTAYDDYGVVYRTGSNYVGLAWGAVVVAIVNMLIIWFTLYRAGKREGIVNMEEGRASTSDEDLEKDRAIRASRT